MVTQKKKKKKKKRFSGILSSRQHNKHSVVVYYFLDLSVEDVLEVAFWVFFWYWFLVVDVCVAVFALSVAVLSSYFLKWVPDA